MVKDSEKLNLSWFWFFASWWIDAWLGSSVTLWRHCNSEPWSLSSYLCACMVVSILLTLLNTLKTRALLALLGQRTITHTCPVIYCFNMGWLLFFPFPTLLLSLVCICLFVCPSACLCVCVCLCVCLSVCFSACLSVGLSIYVSVCLCVPVFVCLSVRVSVCMSLCIMYICMLSLLS